MHPTLLGTFSMVRICLALVEHPEMVKEIGRVSNTLAEQAPFVFAIVVLTICMVLFFLMFLWRCSLQVSKTFREIRAEGNVVIERNTEGFVKNAEAMAEMRSAVANLQATFSEFTRHYGHLLLQEEGGSSQEPGPKKLPEKRRASKTPPPSTGAAGTSSRKR